MSLPSVYTDAHDDDYESHPTIIYEAFMSNDSFLTLADERTVLRDRIAQLNEDLKVAKRELEAVDARFFTKFDEDAGHSWSNNDFTFFISESTNPQVEDWDKFNDYILQERALHLLQRRPTATAYRELLSQGVEVPGVVPFVKRSIGQRKK